MSVRERDPLTGSQHHRPRVERHHRAQHPRAAGDLVVHRHHPRLGADLWILMPSWPLVDTYTGGSSAIDQKEQVDETDRRGAGSSAPAGRTRSRRCPIDEIRADPGADAGGGRDGAGALRRQLRGLPRRGRRRRTGLPEPRRRRLALGRRPRRHHGDPARRHQRHASRDAVSQMLAFGRDGILTGDEIRTVVAYVQSLSRRPTPPEDGARGRGASSSPTTARAAMARTAAAVHRARRAEPATASGSTAATRRPSTGRSTTAGRAGCRRGRAA